MMQNLLRLPDDCFGAVYDQTRRTVTAFAGKNDVKFIHECTEEIEKQISGIGLAHYANLRRCRIYLRPQLDGEKVMRVTGFLKEATAAS